MLFTGYFEPTIEGSLEKSPSFSYPVYASPNDLTTIDLSLFGDEFKGKKITGRYTGKTVVPYYERSDIENGLFTEYIMKALTTTEADEDNDGTVSTDELRNYVSTKVTEASDGLQHPTVDRDNIYQKFGFEVKKR